MSKNGSIFLTKKSVITTFVLSFLIGLIGAIIVAKETNAYAAGVNFNWVIVSVLVPIFTSLLICAILAAIIREFKATTLLLISCLLIPVSFLVFVKVFEFTNISAYMRENTNRNKPIEE